jgi:hypothetical protein
MNWKEYHNKRQKEYLDETYVRRIEFFTDNEKIQLAEAGAKCYHPGEENGWRTRIWLENIRYVLNHGCCNGCQARSVCSILSREKGK